MVRGVSKCKWEYSRDGMVIRHDSFVDATIRPELIVKFETECGLWVYKDMMNKDDSENTICSNCGKRIEYVCVSSDEEVDASDKLEWFDDGRMSRTRYGRYCIGRKEEEKEELYELWFQANDMFQHYISQEQIVRSCGSIKYAQKEAERFHSLVMELFQKEIHEG